MNTLYATVFGHPGWIIVAALCCVPMVLTGIWYDRRASIKKYLEYRRELREQRGILMGRREKQARMAYLKQRWADGITAFGEKDFLDGLQTRDEVNAFYRAIGKTHNIPDIVPVKSKEQLKKDIQYRRAHGIPSPAQEKPAWGDATPAPPKDGNVINASKRFGAKALGLLKKTA